MSTILKEQDYRIGLEAKFFEVKRVKRYCLIHSFELVKASFRSFAILERIFLISLIFLGLQHFEISASFT